MTWMLLAGIGWTSTIVLALAFARVAATADRAASLAFDEPMHRRHPRRRAAA